VLQAGPPLAGALQVGALLLASLLATVGCTSMVSDAQLFRVAQKHHARGRPEQAIQSLNLLMAVHDPRPELRAQIAVTKGEWYEELGRESEAMFLYRYAIERYPDSPYAAEARGRLAGHEGAAGAPVDCPPAP